MRRPPPKAILGLAIAVITFVLIDYVSGGLFGGPRSTTSAQVTVFMCGSEWIPENKLAFRAKFSLQAPEDIRLTLSAFDQVMDLPTRRRLVDDCKHMTVRFNFFPKSVVIPGSKRDLTSTLERCREEDYCLKIDETLLKESRGHFEVRTGLSVSRTSLSTAAVKLGVISGQPNTSIEATADLPDGWIPTSPLPEPTHVSNFSWTKLVWTSDDVQGMSVPNAKGAGRSIAPTIGILLPIQSSRLKTIETTLLFFLSALFGLGFTLLAEWAVAFVTTPKPAVEPSET